MSACEKPFMQPTHKYYPRTNKSSPNLGENPKNPDLGVVEEIAVEMADEQRNTRDETERKFDNMLDLLNRLVKKLEGGNPNPQPQVNQEGNPNQGESSHTAATMDQGSEKSVKYTHSPLPKPAKPMFLQRQEPGPQQAPNEFDTLFIEYQSKNDEFRDTITFESYLNILGKKIGRGSKYDEKRKLQQKQQVPMFNGMSMAARTWLQKLQTYFTLCNMG